MELEKGIYIIHTHTYTHTLIHICTYVYRSVTNITITGEASLILQCLEPQGMNTLMNSCFSNTQSLTRSDTQIHRQKNLYFKHYNNTILLLHQSFIANQIYKFNRNIYIYIYIYIFLLFIFSCLFLWSVLIGRAQYLLSGDELCDGSPAEINFD